MAGVPNMFGYSNVRSISNNEAIARDLGQAVVGAFYLTHLYCEKKRQKAEAEREYLLRTSSFKPETMVYSDALPMLAPQYEIRHTKEGRLYYLNHTTKSTSWEVPEQAVVEVSGPQLNATRSSFKRHLDTADQHIRDGRWDDVFTHLSLAIVDNPNYPRLYFMRGVAAISTARYESAVGDFSTVVKYNSVDKKLALVLRARIYRGMGRYDAAIGDYTLAYRSKPLNDPSDFSMLLLRGHCNAKLRNIPLAIADLTEAIQVFKPEDEEKEELSLCSEGYLYYLRGLLYNATDKLDEAMADLMLSCRSNFFGVDAALFLRASILLRRKDYAAASNCLIEALIFDPDNPAYTSLLDKVNKESGMNVSAISASGDNTGGYRRLRDFIHPLYFDDSSAVEPECMPPLPPAPKAPAAPAAPTPTSDRPNAPQMVTSPSGRKYLRPRVPQGLHEGQLQKRGGGKLSKSYQPRFLVLQPNCINYYYLDSQRGSIPLTATTKVTLGSGEYTFHVVTPTRTWVLKAATEMERSDWMDAVAKAITALAGAESAASSSATSSSSSSSSSAAPTTGEAVTPGEPPVA